MSDNVTAFPSRVPSDGLRPDASRYLERIGHELRVAGSAQTRPGDDVDLWRQAARQAARELGRRVRTCAAPGVAVAELLDWPADERERLLERDRARGIADAIRHVR